MNRTELTKNPGQCRSKNGTSTRAATKMRTDSSFLCNVFRFSFLISLSFIDWLTDSVFIFVVRSFRQWFHSRFPTLQNLDLASRLIFVVFYCCCCCCCCSALLLIVLVDAARQTEWPMDQSSETIPQIGREDEMCSQFAVCYSLRNAANFQPR